MVYCFPVNKC